MNRVVRSLLLVVGMFPFFAAAQVNVSLHRDVEVLVVNGEEVPITFMSKTQYALGNGVNQLVVRVSKLVQSGAEFDKFKTDPMVITFDTNNTDVKIVPARNIVSERDIKDFKQNPSFNLIASSGAKLASSNVVLPVLPGLLRDYAEETLAFNEKFGISLAKITEQSSAKIDIPSNTEINKPAVVTTSIPKAAAVFDEKNAATSADQSMILMQADFLRMTKEEQNTFLKWAVKNIRS